MLPVIGIPLNDKCSCAKQEIAKQIAIIKDNDFFKKYGIYIVGGILVILLGVMTTVIVRKKQRSSVK